MSGALSWFAGNMLWASAAMLLVLALRRPVAHWLGAGAAYALWLVPALRLVAPPADWFVGLFPDSLPSLPPLHLFVGAGEGVPLPLSGPGQWVPILLAVWAGGAFLFLGVQWACYRRFLRRLSLSVESVGDFRSVPLLASGAVDGPLALGLADRRIVVPADFETRYSLEERAVALAHERFHHARGDILANHAALIILALNWFNPVAWCAFRAFRADQELSCDAAVAAAASSETRRIYAHALVKSASRPGLIAACPLNSADQLKRRLKMLNRHKTGRARMLAGAGLTATLLAASVAFAGSSQPQDKTTPPTRERTIIIEEHRTGGESGHADPADVARRNLSPEMADRVASCRDGNQAANIDEGSGDHRTRIMVCTRGGSGANNVEALQSARERIASNTNMSAEIKQRVLAQLDEAIARARAAN